MACTNVHVHGGYVFAYLRRYTLRYLHHMNGFTQACIRISCGWTLVLMNNNPRWNSFATKVYRCIKFSFCSSWWHEKNYYITWKSYRWIMDIKNSQESQVEQVDWKLIWNEKKKIEIFSHTFSRIKKKVLINLWRK